MTSFLLPCRLVFSVALLLVKTNSRSSEINQPVGEPNLDELLDHVENCDVQIIHNGGLDSNFQHSRYLATTIFETQSFPRSKKIMDLCQVRVLKCRIIYAAFSTGGEDPTEWNGRHYPYIRIAYSYFAFRDENGFVEDHRLNINGDMLSLIFFNDDQLVDSATQANHGEQIESLGLVKVTVEHKLRLCFRIQAFRILSPTEFGASCIHLDLGSNVLQIYHENRVAPREWEYDERNINQPEESDLLQIFQESNPFNRLSTKFSIDLHLLQVMFWNSNSSLIYSTDRKKPSVAFHIEVRIESNIGPHWIQTEAGGYSFLTCYSENAISFDFYITPFQPELWYALLTTYFFLTLALSCWLLGKNLETSFCPWMYILGGLLEDGVPIPGKIEKSWIFRIVFGSWIIIGVIFSNCYNGLMITGLNSPLAATTANTFRDLVCNYQEVKFVHSRMKKDSRFYFDSYWYLHYANELYSGNQTLNPYYSNKCFSIFSYPTETSHIPKFFNFLSKIYGNYMDALEVSHGMELELNLFHPRQKPFPKNISTLSYHEMVKVVEREVVDCGKTAFVAPQGEFQAEVEFLVRSYPSLKFYKGKDIVVAKPLGMRIFNPGVSRIHWNAKSLVETGIYTRLTKERYERKNFRRQRAGVYKHQMETMTMDGCILTLFILCAGLAAGAIIVYCMECCIGFKRWIGICRGCLCNWIGEKAQKSEYEPRIIKVKSISERKKCDAKKYFVYLP